MLVNSYWVEDPFTARPIKHFLLNYSNMAITRLLLEAATDNFTMGNYTSNFTDDIVSDIEIPYAEADDSGAVMLKAVGSFMLIFLSFFLR
jgi:hypothetical protein